MPLAQVRRPPPADVELVGSGGVTYLAKPTPLGPVAAYSGKATQPIWAKQIYVILYDTSMTEMSGMSSGSLARIKL